MQALDVQNVRHTYGVGEGAVNALRGISMTLAAGTFTAVMGPSGSGKSTLLNCVAGLEAPTGGSVVVAGTDTNGWSDERRTVLRRERLGIVFQGFHLVPYLTAAQNIGLPMRLAGCKPDTARVAELLDAVGLADRAGRLPSELSGGQQQRVAIARALITNPAVVLADEPTGALDTVAARGVLTLLRDVVDKSGHTVLMVTHDPAAAAIADEVVYLVDGRVAGRMQRPTVDAVAGQLAHLDELAGVAAR